MDDWIEGLRMHTQWNEDGLMNRDILPDDSPEMEFAAGRTWANRQQLKPGKDGEMTSGLGIPLIQFETGPPMITTGDTIGAMIAIPANASHPFETMDFINLLYTDKKMINLVIFGQEGIDYEYVDQARGIVELLDSNWNMVASAWTLGNQLLNYVTTDEDPDKWEQFQRFNDAAIPSPTLGFVPDLTDPDVQTHIATLSAIMERFWDLTMGLVPMNRFDATVEQFKNELDAGGAPELLEEIQRQYDEWRASR
jgi:putative aldouronate transport system substrate-binding protein